MGDSNLEHRNILQAQDSLDRLIGRRVRLRLSPHICGFVQQVDVRFYYDQPITALLHIAIDDLYGTYAYRLEDLEFIDGLYFVHGGGGSGAVDRDPPMPGLLPGPGGPA